MTKTQYKQARRLLRDNGLFALTWLEGATQFSMSYLCDIQKQKDELAERFEIVQWCKKDNIQSVFNWHKKSN